MRGLIWVMDRPLWPDSLTGGEPMKTQDSIPELALAWAEEGREVALATVIRTWGSAPRPVGAQHASIDFDNSAEAYGQLLLAPKS